MTDTGRVNSTPLHAARPGARSLRAAAAAAGGLAAVAAAAVGTVALVRSPATGSDAINAARKITVTAPAMPLSESELVGLLHRPLDLGPFADPVFSAYANILGFADRPVLRSPAFKAMFLEDLFTAGQLRSGARVATP